MSARSQEIAAIERSLGRLKSMARDLMVERCAASMFATAAAAVAAYYCAYFAHGLVFSLSTAAACAALTLGLYSVVTSRGRRRMVTDFQPAGAGLADRHEGRHKTPCTGEHDLAKTTVITMDGGRYRVCVRCWTGVPAEGSE